MPDEREDAVRELVAEWMRRTRSDLAVACMIDDERIASEILAFHAQQAVEKALKTLLVQHQIEFPHTHVIGVILDLCQIAGYEMTEDLTEATSLTRYAVATRYPGAEEMVSREEAQEATDLATRVVAWVETQIEAAA